MTNLFKKAAIFTDIHFGGKSNSETHNQDCLSFMQWMIKTAKDNDCDTCLFLGDYHNNRNTMNLRTMSYVLEGLELLSASFDHTYFIVGNHDQFFREKRDIHSVEWARHIPNITIVNEFFNEGNVSIIPWLLKDEHKKIEKIKAKYCFGHFELPHFLMNGMIQMPDAGEIQSEHFHNVDKVYSGHFHKRQTNNNITYIGNCFPHNYGDANDDARGFMILDWDGKEEFHTWPDQPTYKVLDLSNLIQNAESILKPNMHVRVNLDIDISYEESTFIKETFAETYKLRELTFLPVKKVLEGEVTPGSIEFLSVDQIVTNELTNISSEHYSPTFLLDIYRNL
jgi:DNA repair exonuclease SbcCD nuclease subunit